MKKTKIEDCKIHNLPKIHNRAGNLTVLESLKNVKFDIKRIYYLYDIPGGEERGGHAHKELQQLIIAAGGSFDVVLEDGIERKEFHLDRPYSGLQIVPGIWRELKNFSSGAICLVLASTEYNESDYIRDHEDFIKYKNEKK